MTYARGPLASTLIPLLLLLAGCAVSPAGQIDTSLNNPEAQSQPYEPAIIILGGVYRDRDIGVFKLNIERSITLKFVPLSNVVQVANGNQFNREYLQARLSQRGSVLSVPPGKYRLTTLTSGGGAVSSKHSVPRSKFHDKEYGFSVKGGDVINLGFIEAYFSRQDKIWLDLKVEANEEMARKTLEENTNDPAPYLANLKTRLLNVPNKIW